MAASPARFLRSLGVTLTAVAASLGLGVTMLSTPAYAANPVTPGNFTGYGFDQCDAPSQYAMDRWKKYSPFDAAGIYISGNSRACKTQKNLTATWVRNQLANGWRLLPITLGPQASCSTRFPRYGARIDPTINPSSTNTYAAARSQGKLEAQRAVAAAKRLGIVPGSTLFYDLEAFNIKLTGCRTSALWFVSAWTNELHRLGYVSGYYSSAASGIRMVDDARVTRGNRFTLPDQVWIADWNRKANTSSSYIRSDGWQPYSRLKQYRGGHKETHGGVTINIDSNYLNLRTPKIPGVTTGETAAPTPAPTPAPSPTPPASSAPAQWSMKDARCSTRSINKRAYRFTSARTRTGNIAALQCLLKQQYLYKRAVTGKWNTTTTSGIRAFQRRVGHKQRKAATRADWVALLSAGNSGTVLKRGTRHSDVIRVQRAMNSATGAKLAITGVYDARTQRTVRSYQRKLRIKSTGVVATLTWAALRSGRW